jgi:hypothetical protein
VGKREGMGVCEERSEILAKYLECRSGVEINEKEKTWAKILG